MISILVYDFDVEASVADGERFCVPGLRVPALDLDRGRIALGELELGAIGPGAHHVGREVIAAQLVLDGQEGVNLSQPGGVDGVVDMGSHVFLLAAGRTMLPDASIIGAQAPKSIGLTLSFQSFVQKITL